MFIEEAEWIRYSLQQLKTREGDNLVANLGSSTYHFRTKVQPHLQNLIVEPLIKNNWNVVNIDIKKEEGVDIVANVSDHLFGLEYKNTFSLTICTNMLEHVESIPDVINNLMEITKKNGHILITVPYKYKIHFDPIDNGFRPKPSEVFSLFGQGTVEIVRSGIISIHNKVYYPHRNSRFPFWGYREMVKYYLGIRHKVTCLLLKVTNK